MTRAWRWRASAVSLRLRIVLITAVAVGAMVAVGGFLTVRAVEAEFEEAAASISRDRALEVSRLAAEGQMPERLGVVDEGETFLQVVRDGTVLASTANLSGSPALALDPEPPGSMRTRSVDDLGAHPGPYQVTTVGATTPDGQVTVVAAVTTEDLAEVVSSALAVGSLGLLVLLVPLSLILWVAVGRALAPVEVIRERADTITAEDLHARVPVPVRNDEIGRLARTINSMLARLDRSASEQRRFVADAAHELRSPVASLRAQLETASGTTLTGGSPEVEDLLAVTLRMQTLVDELLLLARSDGGALTKRDDPVDLDDVVASVVGALRLEHRRPEVSIDTHGVTPVQVLGDAGLLDQVVRNLLDNAARYAVREVRVALVREGDTAVLTVDDDGPGVPPESRAVVFDRFTRLDESRDRNEGGVGLGLAIVTDLVRAHHGEVSVSDAPTGGARFEVRLPVEDAAVPGATEAPAGEDI